jgi:zinc and cadmium transporter
MFIELIIASILIMGASLIGVVTVWKSAGSYVGKNLNFLVSFAAGVFLLLVYSLSSEVLLEAPSIETGLFWILLGLVLVSIAVKSLPEAHHHHDDSLEKDPHSKLDARRMIIGDSLHNIGDGILLAVAFSVGTPLGIATALSLFFHEFVQEISEFFVLKQAGYSSKRALTINFMTAGTILVGSIGGFFFLESFSHLEVPVLGLATGALLALLIQDLIPHSIQTMKAHKCVTKHILMFVMGALVMFTVLSYTDDSHSHGHPESPEEHLEH